MGKSTLFNALTGGGAAVATYAFATVEANTGVVPVPDERLYQLAGVFNPQKTTPATVTFVDIAGLVRGASHGEGLGNQFLAQIRECDAIAMVVRCFEDANVSHVTGRLDPSTDIEVVDYELILADLEVVARRKERTAKAVQQKRGDATELEALERVESALNEGTPARRMELSPDESAHLRELSLLSLKPVIYIVNVGEGEAARGGPCLEAATAMANAERARCVPISARLEAELQELDEAEAKEYLATYGLSESGLGRVARAAYDVLGLITFFTAGEKECRAWTIRAGTRAPQAASTIHTDFERGFIKAEVADWKDLVELGGWAQARAAAKVRLEGKDYVFRDGDTTVFRFNV